LPDRLGRERLSVQRLYGNTETSDAAFIKGPAAVTVWRPLHHFERVPVSRAISSQPPRDPKARWVSAVCFTVGRIPLLWETIIDVRKF
jgi:hypothetical protein